VQCVASLYTQNMAVVSRAGLTDEELLTVLHVAMADGRVQESLSAAGRAVRLLVYVVPMEWNLPDLPLEIPRGGGGGHHMPGDFDRRLYKVLFSKARTHDQTASGREIVTKSYGLDPVILARVITEANQPTGIE